MASLYGLPDRPPQYTGSGQMRTLFQVAREINERLTSIFLRDAGGRRPVYGGAETLQSDPHWRDHLLFYEYFHGDNGAGLGASHQTGWTGIIARSMHLFATASPERVRELLTAYEESFTEDFYAYEPPRDKPGH